MIKILVCGGRDYGTRMTEDHNCVTDYNAIELLEKTLNNLLAEFGDITIIQGEARGADLLAKRWAISKNIPVIGFPADWKSNGRAAGYLRNVQMLEEGEPDLVVAFPGGRGTAMMCTLAKQAGVRVRKISL